MDMIPKGMLFKTPQHQNFVNSENRDHHFRFQFSPPSFNEYEKAFNAVQQEISYGNSYLLNLTFRSRIDTDLTLTDIFHISSAKFKLLLPDQFVVFSPEPFVRIRNGIISSYPMKGTIDASIKDAANILLSDEKETAEHNTIVDLIRNDLAMVSADVKVEKFRYLEKIITNRVGLLQMSSEISGTLPEDHLSHLGDILIRLLPAGSVTGAPKAKTVQIIEENENYTRGYYTGIFGYFDGEYLESAVMIRFIEQEDEQLWFKSGGGITSLSNVDREYQELISKIYIPLLT